MGSVRAKQLGADHWRARAAEARELAEQRTHGQARSTMLRIASEYERLAERAETRRMIQRPGAVSPGD